MVYRGLVLQLQGEYSQSINECGATLFRQSKIVHPIIAHGLSDTAFGDWPMLSTILMWR